MRSYAKVSIIIPVYNGSNFMQEAIHSALSQTYPNIEVIVVNDGSKDNGETERIALSYGNRIRYFSKENGGVSTALNLGIEKMEGEYFSWLSHDDIYAPEKIEKQMELLQKLSHETILYGGYELVNEKSEKFGQVVPDLLYSEEKLNIPMFPLLRGLINGCTLLIHKSHFQRVGLFDPRLRSTQDYDLWFKMFRGAKIKYHQGLYVKSRSHSEQGTNSIPKHEEDCSKLWIHMMNNITEEEMCAMDGSVYSFRIKTEEFLRLSTPYKQAIGHAKIKLKEATDNLDREINHCKVSVIVPFYNRIELLLDSVRSVLKQTHTNFELLLVDDGSTEDSAALKSLIEKDKRIRYYRQDHKGTSAARNLGIAKSSGHYIAFLDSDDLFKEDKLRTQLEYMIKNSYEFSHTSYQRISGDGNYLEVINSGDFSGNIFPRILWGCSIATPTVMISKNIIQKHRFNEQFDIGEDVCFWIDLAYKHPIGGIIEPLTLVRVNNNSAALDVGKQRIGLTNILSYIVKNPYYSNYHSEINILINDLLSLFNGTTVPHTDQSQAIPIIVRPRGKLKRLFISLGYEGYTVTIRKIAYKIKLKMLKQR